MFLKPYIHYVSVLALVGLTFLSTVYFGKARFLEYMPVRTTLPARIGEAEGSSVVFCQNERCLKSFIVTNVVALTICSSCGGGLDEVSLPEKRNLPRDTQINRKSYEASGKARYQVTIVTTGNNRTGIHRPEMCMEGQGFHIVGQDTMPVPLPGKRILRVALVDSVTSTSLPDGTIQKGNWIYAYWFVGGGQETSSHYERMARSASDNLLHNVIYRWAFISVLARTSESTRSTDMVALQHFIAELYPVLDVSK